MFLMKIFVICNFGGFSTNSGDLRKCEIKCYKFNVTTRKLQKVVSYCSHYELETILCVNHKTIRFSFHKILKYIGGKLYFKCFVN